MRKDTVVHIQFIYKVGSEPVLGQPVMIVVVVLAIAVAELLVASRAINDFLSAVEASAIFPNGLVTACEFICIHIFLLQKCVKKKSQASGRCRFCEILKKIVNF